MRSPLRIFEVARPFKPGEAWLLFRLAAFGEAAGWTLLIAGIILKRYFLNGNNLPVLIAGQFHGTLFIIYMTAAVGLYPSLHWTRKRAVVALIASVPPYGSLLFERWAAYKLKRSAFTDQIRFLKYLEICHTAV